MTDETCYRHKDADCDSDRNVYVDQGGVGCPGNDSGLIWWRQPSPTHTLNPQNGIQGGGVARVASLHLSGLLPVDVGTSFVRSGSLTPAAIHSCWQVLVVNESRA